MKKHMISRNEARDSIMHKSINAKNHALILLESIFATDVID